MTVVVSSLHISYACPFCSENMFLLMLHQLHLAQLITWECQSLLRAWGKFLFQLVKKKCFFEKQMILDFPEIYLINALKFRARYWMAYARSTSNAPPIMLPQNYPQLNLPLALWFSICISMIKYISDILLLPVDIYQGFPKYVDGWGSGFNIVSSSHYLPVRLNYYCPISFWRIWGAAKLSNLPLARRWIQPGTG